LLENGKKTWLANLTDIVIADGEVLVALRRAGENGAADLREHKRQRNVDAHDANLGRIFAVGGAKVVKGDEALVDVGARAITIAARWGELNGVSGHGIPTHFSGFSHS
jgi:hypothetical protein